MFGESLYLRDKLFGKNQTLTEGIRRGFLTYDAVRSFGVAHSKAEGEFAIREMTMGINRRFAGIRSIDVRRRWLVGAAVIASAARFEDVQMPSQWPDYTVMIPRRVAHRRRPYVV